jgi:hypothetical protein
LERLEEIAGILETPLEDLLRQDSVYIHQKVKEASGSGFGTGDIYNYGIEKEMVNKLIDTKNDEINILRACP